MKKIISLVLTIALLASLFCLTPVFRAAESVEPVAVGSDNETAAEPSTETAAETADMISDKTDDGEIAQTGSGSKIYFDASGTGWGGYSIIMVYCYLPETGEVQIDWASRKRGGMTDEGNDIWSYDFDAKGIDIEPGRQYSLIFNADTGAQTHDLLFDTTCFGDTAYCDGNRVENPVDSGKKVDIARWKSGRLGPMKCITSVGHVVGEVVPFYTSPYAMFVDFLSDTGSRGLQNALNYSSDKSAQRLIDEVASAFGLTKRDVERAIEEAKRSYDWSREWSAEQSSLPGSSSDSGNIDWSAPNPYRNRTDINTPYSDFCRYLTGGGFANDCRIYGNKTEQQIIDDAANRFGLYRDDVETALKESNAQAVSWNKSKSTLKAGTCGIMYVQDGYYLLYTGSKGDHGVAHVDKNALMEYQNDSGYYVISGVPLGSGDTVQVARFNGGGSFTVVSKITLLIPEDRNYLFFFRADDSNFGFNTDEEYSNIAYSRAGSATGDGKIRVYMSDISDEKNGVKLSWTKPSGVSIAKFRVFTKQDGKWKKLGDTDKLTFTHTAAVSGQSYCYTLRGLDSSGNYCTAYVESGWYHRYLAAPTITGVTNSADGATIRWKSVGGNARYRVFVKDGINWVSMGDTYETSFLHAAKARMKITVNETTDDDESDDYYWYETELPNSYDPDDNRYSPVEDGLTYTYMVRCVSYTGKARIGAYDAEGYRNLYESNVAPILNRPVITGAYDSDDGMLVVWSAVPGAVKYRVFFRARYGWYRLGDTTDTEFLDTTINNKRRVTTKVAYHGPGEPEPTEGQWYFRRYMVVCVSEDGQSYVSYYDNDGYRVEYTDRTIVVEPAYLRGDYDGDFSITIMDATRAQNIIADLVPRPAEEYLFAVDADGDKELTIMDATRIQNVLAELMTMDGNRMT